MDGLLILLGDPTCPRFQQSVLQNKQAFCDYSQFVDTNQNKNGIILKPNNTISIGRSDTCNFITSDPTTSFLHAYVWCVKFNPNSEPLFYLKDCSLNGTFVNGELVGHGKIVMLSDRDIITIRRGPAFELVGMGCEASATTGSLDAGYLELTNCIGFGSFGSVYIGRKKQPTEPIQNSKHTNSMYAVKMVKGCPKTIRKIMSEAQVLERIDHPNIVKVHDYFVLSDHLYIVEDFHCGGDLFSYLTRANDLRYLPEPEVILIVYQVLKALHYLHNCLGIMHRDLKLDNVLLTAPMPQSKIIICDFGTAALISKKPTTCAGTAEFAAPEMFTGNYDHKCDIWSVGIMTHIMLSGISPFHCIDADLTIKKAASGRLQFDPNQWKGISSEAQDFVRCLLTIDVTQRLSVERCFSHPWLKMRLRYLQFIYQKIIL